MPILTKKLTRGEKLVLLRRRNGWSMTQAAKKQRVPLSEYRLWELDQGKNIPVVKLDKVKDGELCYIARRREGLSLAQIAKKLRCCRWWVSQMESGVAPVTRLAEYWAA